MKAWPKGSFDHCITDPPYNMSKKNGLGWAFSSHVTMSESWDIFERKAYLNFTKAWLRQVKRLVRPNGNIVVFGSFHNIYDIGYILNELDLRILNSIVWYKPNAQPNITCRTLTESTEHAIWACNAPRDKAKKWVFNYQVAKQLNRGKQMRNVWDIPYPSQTERRFGKHPSQKALSVIGRLVLLLTKPNDLVLDCFGGSGTTGIVCQSYGRRWVMIEKSKAYIQVAESRLRHVTLPYPQELLQMEMDLSDAP